MQERVFAIAHFADQGVLWLLIGLSIMATFMIIERFFALRKLVTRSKTLKESLAQAMGQGDLSQTLEHLKGEDSFEGLATRRVLTHIEKNGCVALDEVFNTMQSIEKPKLEKSLSFLATVGANAPYIGLFGTVLGIMKSFQEMSTSAGAGQAGVMAGISGALIATAAGLMVAIPSVLSFNYFTKQVKTILSGFEVLKESIVTWAKVNESRNPGGRNGC